MLYQNQHLICVGVYFLKTMLYIILINVRFECSRPRAI